MRGRRVRLHRGQGRHRRGLDGRRDDEQTAAGERAEQQEQLEKFDGDFDIPRETIDESSYVPAYEGTGRLVDTQVGGWSGLRLTKTYRSDGQSDTLRSTTVMLTAGLATLTIDVITDENGDDAAIADQVIDEYLARLG